MKSFLPCALLAAALVTTAGLAATGQPERSGEALIIVSNDFDAAAWTKNDPQSRSVPRPLRGGPTDARMMADLLRWRYGIPAGRIRILGLRKEAIGKGYHYVSPHANRDLVAAELRRIAASGASHRSRRVSPAVVYYSGHGDSIYDTERLSKSTEYLVCRDGPLFDFEVDAALAPAVGRLTMIIDCCFSGGSARSVDSDLFGTLKSARGIGGRAVLGELARRKGEVRFKPGSGELPEGSNRVLLAACKRNEEAAEVAIPGSRATEPRYAGAFTLALYRTLINFGGDLTHTAVIREVRNRIASWRRCPQEPLRQGGRPEWPIVGPSILPSRSIPVEHGRLQAGSLAGLRVGEQFIAPDRTLHRVKSVDWFSAELEPLQRTAATPVTVMPHRRLAAADARTPGLFGVRLRSGSGGPEMPDDVAEDSLGLVITKDPVTGDYSVEVVGPGGTQSSIGKEPTEEAARRRASGLLGQFNQIGKLRALLSQLSEASDGLLDVSIKLDRGDFFPQYHFDETMKLTVDSRSPGYLLLLGFEPDGTVSVLYPHKKATEPRSIRQHECTLTAGAPAGNTNLVAVVSRHPLVLPQPLLELAAPDALSYRIRDGKVEAFAGWLSEALAKAGREENDQQENQLLRPGDVAVAGLELVVSAKK